MKKKLKILSIIFVFLLLSIPIQAGQEFWGSITSNKYHYPTCKLAKKISPENLVKFNSAEEAVEDGYAPCPVCHPPLPSKSEKETINSINAETNQMESSEIKNVLFLTCESPDYPTNSVFINTVKSKLQEGSKFAINYSYEYLHLNYYYADTKNETTLVQFLKQKYQSRQPDIVIAHSVPFIKKYSDNIFPRVPVIYSGNETNLGSASTSPYFMSYQGTYDLKKAFQVITQLQPATKKIYIVIGDTQEERNALLSIKQITNYEYPTEFIFLNNLPFAEMLEIIKKLDRNSVVLYFHVFRDTEGKTFVPIKALRMLRQESPVPIYGIGEQYVGNGSIGGYVYNREAQGKHVAEIVALIFSGRKILEFHPEKISFGEYVFDGQELQYWKIDENRLPYGSKVEYKKNSVWIANKWLAAAVLIIIIVETLLIALLLLNTFRRKKTETSVAELNLQMEENAAERTKKLEEAIEKLTAAKEFQAATATELVRLYGQQYMTSRKDRLTGLYNRVHMEEKIQEEFAYFLRNGRLFSLVISDIDFFKRVNDTFGHDAGDCLLKSIADVLQESIREFDIVARWGGEEFLFLLPEIDAEGAVILAERIRKRIEEQTYFYGNTELRATMTFGVSSIKADDTVEDVIKRADTALFDGKRNGRNRVMSA